MGGPDKAEEEEEAGMDALTPLFPRRFFLVGGGSSNQPCMEEEEEETPTHLLPLTHPKPLHSANQLFRA